MATTLSKLYQYEVESFSGVQIIGTITDLTTEAPANSTILVDILSHAIASSGGYSVFLEFADYTRTQLIISNVSGSLTLVNTEVIYNVNNTTGSTAITWDFYLSGDNLILEADAVGITQSAFITAKVTIQS